MLRAYPIVEWKEKGEIHFHKDVTLQQKTFARFHIFDPNKGRTGRLVLIIHFFWKVLGRFSTVTRAKVFLRS